MWLFKNKMPLSIYLKSNILLSQYTYSIPGLEHSSFTIHIQQMKTPEPAESPQTTEKTTLAPAARNRQAESLHTIQQLIGRRALAADVEDQ